MRCRVVLAAVVAAVVGIGVLSGCGGQSDAPRAFVMGSADTPEMTVMAQVYATVLRGAGAAVSPNIDTGDDAALMAQMQQADVDLFPAFTSALLSQLAPALESPTPAPTSGAPATGDDVDPLYKDLSRSLPQGVSVGDPTPVAATPQLFVATSLAASAGADDLSQCARLPADLPVVVTAEPDSATLAAFTDAGCRPGPVEVVADATAALARAGTGTAVALLTPLQVAGDTASGPAGDVTALAATDTAPGPRAEVLVPIYRTASLTEDQVKAINRVAGEITTADLATMADDVRGGASPAVVAGDWVNEHGV
ncbi:MULTISPECIES: glycine betaine ABC transporter substrate-binding protein [unclassified Gordonia (in: high G+C Gram-positive bacteria)]